MYAKTDVLLCRSKSFFNAVNILSAHKKNKISNRKTRLTLNKQ